MPQSEHVVKAEVVEGPSPVLRKRLELIMEWEYPLTWWRAGLLWVALRLMSLAGVGSDAGHDDNLQARLLERATAVFGTRSLAEEWLDTPALALDGKVPNELVRTPAGVEMVERLLTQLEHGVYT